MLADFFFSNKSSGEIIGQNTTSVFATPPRWYGFTDAVGFQEAVDAVKTLKAF